MTRNWMNVWVLLLILACCPSCTTQERVIETRTEYPVIPQGLLTLPEMPPKETNHSPLVGGLDTGKELRRYGCIMHSRLQEIVRYATGGKTIIEDLKDSDCVDLNY